MKFEYPFLIKKKKSMIYPNLNPTYNLLIINDLRIKFWYKNIRYNQKQLIMSFIYKLSISHNLLEHWFKEFLFSIITVVWYLSANYVSVIVVLDDAARIDQRVSILIVKIQDR